MNSAIVCQTFSFSTGGLTVKTTNDTVHAELPGLSFGDFDRHGKNNLLITWVKITCTG